MSPEQVTAARTPWQAQLVLLAAIWGLSFLFIKVAEESFAALQVALFRLVLGAAVLLVAAAVRRDPLPRDPRVWGHLAVAGLISNAAPFVLFSYGETRVPSVIAGIMNSTTPLITLAVALVVLPDERPNRQRIVGLVLGLAGVLVVLGVWRGLAGPDLLGSLLCLAAAACYGIGFPYARRYLAGRRLSTLSLSAAQLSCATVELALVTPFLTSVPHSVSLPAGASIAVLGLLGTGFAYILNYNLIRRAGATLASTVTYLIPVFSVLAGVVVLHEPLTWNLPVGAGVIIVGAAVSQGVFARRRLA